MPAPTRTTQVIVGEPEVVEDATRSSAAEPVEASPAWLRLKAAATAIQDLQIKDGSIPDAAAHDRARETVAVDTPAKRAISAIWSRFWASPGMPSTGVLGGVTGQCGTVSLKDWRSDSLSYRRARLG